MAKRGYPALVLFLPQRTPGIVGNVPPCHLRAEGYTVRTEYFRHAKLRATVWLVQ